MNAINLAAAERQRTAEPECKEISASDLHVAMTGMSDAIVRPYNMKSLVGRCCKYVDDCVWDELANVGIPSLSLNDECAAVRLIAKASEKHLEAFVRENWADVWELFGDDE